MKLSRPYINISNSIGLTQEEKMYANKLNTWMNALEEGGFQVSPEELLNAAIRIHEQYITVYSPDARQKKEALKNSRKKVAEVREQMKKTTEKSKQKTDQLVNELKKNVDRAVNKYKNSLRGELEND